MKNKLHYIAAIMALAIGLASCSDDDSFSASPSNVLFMETDTLSLDTVFSTVPTAHKQFKVYNLSGDGIRIASVRLKSGNQTGFRVNVNGTYLSPQLGYGVTDMELRKGDSLRVFVELTSHDQNDTQPRLVDDDLVFTLESGVQQSVNLRAWSWDAYILRDVTIGKDTVIGNAEGKPVVVYGRLTVPEGRTLAIEPATTLYFHSGAGIDVKGTLLAKGEKDREITMRCDRLDRMVSNLTYDNNPGQWDGIHFYEESYDNLIEYADIHGGMTAVQCDSATDAARQRLAIRNATIHNMKGYGVYAVASKISMENTQISNAFAACLYFLGGEIGINHCTVAQYYPFDAARGPALFFANAKGDVEFPISLNVRNSIIKGYGNDVIYWSYGSIPAETGINARFYDSLLRTVLPAEEKDLAVFDNSSLLLLEEAADVATPQPAAFFQLFDTHYFFYDFTPKEGTKAIGNANPETTLSIDRRGKERTKERHDLGCYETDF